MTDKEIVRSLDSAKRPHSVGTMPIKGKDYNRIKWESEQATFLFVIDERNTCFMTYIFPVSEMVTEDIIITFNEEYKKINSTEWETIINRRKCIIWHLKSKDDIDFFCISSLPSLQKN